VWSLTCPVADLSVVFISQERVDGVEDKGASRLVVKWPELGPRGEGCGTLRAKFRGQAME